MDKPIIVIPTYNEAKNIVPLTKAIFEVGIANLHIIIVDDNSPDGTAKEVNEMNDERITVIKRAGKLGLGSAYIEGFTKAMELNATHIFQMDADFSHDPKDVPKLLAACKQHDLSIGSRKIAGGNIVGWGPIRIGMSTGAMLASRLLLGLKTKDVTAGFRCFKTTVLKSINLSSIKSNGYAFQEELLFRVEKNEFSIKEIPVTFVDRQHGKSKLSKKDIIEFFAIIWKLRKLK